MTKPCVSVLWPTEENYERFRAVCVDSIHDDFATYMAVVGPKLEGLKKQGVDVRRVAFDPDDLLAFAKDSGGQVDSQMRASYAAALQAERRGT